MHLLIAAAGSGRRMGAERNKLLLPLLGRPILAWTLDAAIKASSITWIGIIGQDQDKIEIIELLKDSPKPFRWIQGGNTRQQSVQKGLAALPSDAEHVLIHDGARCLVEPELFNSCTKEVLLGEAVIAATPVTDTIKCVDRKGFIVATPDRSELWAAQTPQCFSVDELRHGHKKALAENIVVTDDASLYEYLSWPVKILDAGPSNIKVTTPFDLIIAEAVLVSRLNV